MEREQVYKLTEQTQLGEEAEMALRCCERLFPAMREEIYRQMEGETAPDMALLRAKLVVLRGVEERLGAYIRSGRLALKELEG
jgi:hypothetical protein